MAARDRVSARGPGIFGRFWLLTAFGAAFGYIEAAVVVYLRAIFYPDGFRLPLVQFGHGELWRRLLLTKIGREAATMVLISSGAWLIGRNIRERLACFLVIFALWDIFYYVWLKVLIDWPGSIMDWDILFLIPIVWASPVLAPVLISALMLVFGIVILRFNDAGRGIKVNLLDWFGFFVSVLVMVMCFCLAGRHIAEADFASHFWWWLFGSGYLLAVGVLVKCIGQSKSV